MADTADTADVRVIFADCLEAMRALPEASVDAIVTDPPYGLAFMGKGWDHGVPGVEYWREALRVAKPGAHLVAFGGTRTFHRLTCAIEDAGWEVRDCLSWLYGSGFPKSLDVSKAIDRRRYDLADVYRVTAWVRAARDAAGVTNAQIDAALGFAGMSSHWTSAKSQPSVPPLDQVPTLLDVLRVAPDDVPQDIRRLLWDLNGLAGQPGKSWTRREVIGSKTGLDGSGFGNVGHGLKSTEIDITAPATDAARQWSGWGTALKPAWEPIILARKPLVSTVASNVLAHGTGAINVDGCRIEGKLGGNPDRFARTDGGSFNQFSTHPPVVRDSGRWPANVVLGCACDGDAHDDDCAAAMLDAQTGTLTSGSLMPHHKRGEQVNAYGKSNGASPSRNFGGDSGGASRFFYTAKASRSERGEGNTHPTVKPIALMRWLVKLVCPPGGTILDPFAGSGTTLIAARSEGFDAVGVEREAEYVEIIRRRLEEATPEWLREIELEGQEDESTSKTEPEPTSLDDLLGFNDE